MGTKILTFIKRGTAIIIAAVCAVPLMPASSTSALSGSQFKSDRIIDDSVIYDKNRMSSGDIQNFLNSKVPVCDTQGTQMRGSVTRKEYAASKGVSTPFICLKNYRQNITARPGDDYCRAIGASSNRSAAEIIKIVSDACGYSPMAMLVLLQKEQSLVTDDWPWPVQYRSATGYGCPDTAACDSAYYGFFNQVYSAARQFKRYAQNPHLYGYRAGRSNYIQYNPNTGCGGSGVSIMNNGTAGLYNYTPYQPNRAALNNIYGAGDGCSSYGNLNFWKLYNNWFGSPITSRCAYDASLPVYSDVDFRKFSPNVDAGEFTIYSGTSTQCVEVHTWADSFNGWRANTASNRKALIPTDCKLKFADVTGDGRDEPILMCFRNTGSGKVEFHIWDTTMRTWILHAISNLPSLNTAETTIEFGDVNGDGRDEPVAIGYNNTQSGKVEYHYWDDGLKNWHSHVVTNLPTISPANMNLDFADINGDGKDEAIAVGVGNTSSGKIEFHVWAPGQWAWQSHITTNQTLVDMSKFNIRFGNFKGKGPDQGVLIGKRATASGKIEFHIWEPSLTEWQSHITSNQGIL